MTIFRYSFLGKITEISEEDSNKILENSRFIKWLLKIYSDWMMKITHYSKTSFIANYVIEFKNKLHVLPVKIGGIIIITATLSDIFFYVLLKNVTQYKEIGLLGWIIRGMLLFVGLTGLFCKIDLKNLLSTSLVLKLLNDYRQRGVASR